MSTDSTSIEKYTEIQFPELQLLANMYAPDELVFQSGLQSDTTGASVSDLRSVLEAGDEETFAAGMSIDGVEFVLHLKLQLPEPVSNVSKKKSKVKSDDTNEEVKSLGRELPLEVTIHLEPTYPDVPLQFFLRIGNCSQSYDLKILREAAQQFLTDSSSPCDSGLGLEPMAITFIQWIQENGVDFITPSIDAQQTQRSTGSQPNHSKKLQRYWIYSHHIYSLTKRRNLVAIAEELHLGGFSLIGKPGIICFEGDKQACVDYYERIRRWAWKHLELRRLDECDSKKNSAEEFERFCKFDGRFEELHVKMGVFKSYIVEKGFSESDFNVLFGFATKD